MRKLWFKLINIVGVLSMITVLFSNVILATAEESNKNLNVSVVYPENKSGITATEDWATVNLDLSIPNLKTGETMTLSMDSGEFSYSKTPFTIGQVKVEPNSDNTWTITALSDINNGNISLNLALRYTNYISEDTKKNITFTLKNPDGSNQTGTIEINVLKYVDLVSKKELVRKVPLGFTENGNIAWVIYLNYNQAGLTGSKETPFKIKDTVGENQELVSNSIAVYNVNTPTLIDSEGNKIRNQDHDDYNYEVSQFLQSQVSATGIDYENSVNEIPGDDTNAYYIYLETKPDKEVASDEIFKNSIYMSISYEGENAWEDQDLAIITKDKNSYGDGIGSVQLTKVDSNTGKSLSGAIFKIIDSTTGKLVKENLTTSVDGVIYVGGLEPGNYAFVETTAPPGYALSEEHYTFTINKNDVSRVNVTAENELLQSGKIKIVKQDKDTKAKLADAQFEVKNTMTGITKIVTTDKNGEVIIDGLSLDEVYEIKETKAPTGYQLDSTVHKVTLSATDANKTVTVTVDNKAQETGSIKIIKQDKDTKAKLADAQFELTDTSNGFKSYLSTNSNGELLISKLSLNRTYEIKEIKAPTGYQLDSTVHKVTLSATDANKTVTVNVDNKAQETGSIKIVKQDKDTKAKLAGAQFEWTDTSNGFKGTFTVGSDGGYTLKNMSLNRTYEIKETKAPTGYQLDSTVHKVTLSATDGNKTVTVNVDNKAQETGSIKIVKQDKDTKAKLAGAQFEWTDISNGFKGTFTVGSDGNYTLKNMSLNRTYEIKETKAPTGYQLDSTVHKVTLSATDGNKTVTVNVDNKAQETGSIKIVKQDKDTKAKLAGAQFEWTDTSNGFKGTFTVGSDGSYTLKNMSLNRTYEIKEIKAPTGYQLDNAVHKVTLSATDGNKTVTVNVDNKAQETGSIKIVKQDKDTKAKLADAQFELTDTSNGFKSYLSTNSNGELLISKLSLNRTYEIKEIKAPTGYQLDSTVHKVTLSATDANKTVTVTVDNKVQETGSIKIVKQDKDTKAKLADAQFELTDTSNGFKSYLSTNSNGELLISKLSLNRTYEIKEIKAPTGYQLDSTVHKVTLSATDTNKIVTVNVDNKAQENGSIKIVKQDKDTKAKLAGAQFEWTDTSNGYKGYVSSDSNGEIIISGLSINRTYEIKEIKAPTGYQLDSAVHKVTLSATDANKTVTVNVANKAQETGSIKIVKQDVCTSQRLSGAQFEWTDTSNGYKGYVSTNSNGEVIISGLSVNRTYEIKEIRAPEGYQLDGTVHKITLNANEINTTKAIVLCNQQKFTSILYKYIDCYGNISNVRIRAIENFSPANQIEYKIYQKDGKLVKHLFTGLDGYTMYFSLVKGWDYNVYKVFSGREIFDFSFKY